MGFEATTTAVVMSLWLALLIYLLSGLREADGLSNASAPPVKDETRRWSVLATARILGEKIMSALDDALARFTAFVKDVATQLAGAKVDNDAQTARLAELQAKLDAALSDDAADKAQIATLQADIATLQDRVAAQINAAVEALTNAPVEAPVETPVVEAPVVEDVPVSTDTAPVVEGEGAAPVE